MPPSVPELPHDARAADTSAADTSATDASATAASAADTARRKAYRRIVLPLFVTSVIAYLDRVNLSYAALTMNEDLGFSDEVYGFGSSVFFVGYVLFEVPGALIAERTSPRLWLARIMFSWGVISALMAWVREPWQFYTVRFLLGVAEASLYPVIYASCIPRWFRSRDRPRAIALLLASMQCSSILGAPLAGWLLDTPLLGLKGWQGLFILEAAPAVVFAFVLVVWMADTPARAAWLSPAERRALEASLAEEDAQRFAVRTYTVAEALRDPMVLRLSITYFLWITGFWGFTYWMPTALKAASGLSNLEVGWLLVVPMSLSLGVMLWIGHSASRTGERRWHAAGGLFVAGAGLLIGTRADHPAVQFTALCLTAIGVYAPFGVWWSLPTSFLSGPAAAGAVGLINSFGNTGGAVGPSILGFLRESTGGPGAGWSVLAAALFLAGALILTLPRSHGARG